MPRCDEASSSGNSPILVSNWRTSSNCSRVPRTNSCWVSVSPLAIGRERFLFVQAIDGHLDGERIGGLQREDFDQLRFTLQLSRGFGQNRMLRRCGDGDELASSFVQRQIDGRLLVLQAASETWPAWLRGPWHRSGRRPVSVVRDRRAPFSIRETICAMVCCSLAGALTSKL